jgi:hypothetical protein
MLGTCTIRLLVEKERWSIFKWTIGSNYSCNYMEPGRGRKEYIYSALRG